MKRDCPATLSGIHLYRQTAGTRWIASEWVCACGRLASDEEREWAQEGLRQTEELQRRMGEVEAE